LGRGREAIGAHQGEGPRQETKVRNQEGSRGEVEQRAGAGEFRPGLSVSASFVW
jgi:hypothetical protein